MNDVSWPDLPVVAADALADTRALDLAVAAVGQQLRRLALLARRWIGPELHTPGNSAAPRVVHTEPGPWHGVIIVDDDVASYWLLVRSGSGRRTTANNEPWRAEPRDAGYERQWSNDQPPLWPDERTWR